MKMEIKGKIEEIGTKGGTGAKGSWTRWAFKIAGQTYSTFNEEIGNKYHVGDFVKVVTKTDPTGKYENMISMEKAEDKNGDADEPNKDINVGFSKTVEDLLRQILAELKRDAIVS